jgi:hypothetical protein
MRIRNLAFLMNKLDYNVVRNQKEYKNKFMLILIVLDA